MFYVLSDHTISVIKIYIRPSVTIAVINYSFNSSCLIAKTSYVYLGLVGILCTIRFFAFFD